MNRNDVFHTFHEPRAIPYYYGPLEERGSVRYIDHPVRMSQGDVTMSIKKIKEEAPAGSIVFIKDMAYYLCGPDGDIDDTLLKEVLDVIDINTFLIRNPTKQVSSLHKMSTTQQNKVGWESFNPSEIGYVELGLVHDAVINQGKTTVVVDADDILKSPKSTLMEYCERAGISFSDHMLSWEPNEESIVKKFAEWGGWHDSAISSSGWERKHTTATGESSTTSHVKGDDDDEVDETKLLIQRCIEDAMIHYVPLFNERVGQSSD